MKLYSICHPYRNVWILILMNRHVLFIFQCSLSKYILKLDYGIKAIVLSHMPSY